MYQCQTTLQAFAQIRDGVPDDADLLRGDPALAAIYNMLERPGGRGDGRGRGRAQAGTSSSANARGATTYGSIIPIDASPSSVTSADGRTPS